MNNVIIFVDKITGKVEQSAKGTKYLKEGTLHLTVGNTKETVRVNWMNVDADMLNKPGTAMLELEVSTYEGKSYPRLTVKSFVPAFSNLNLALITGEVVSFKDDLNKMLPVRVKISHTDWSGNVSYAEQELTLMDKKSPLAESIRNSKGKQMFFTATFSASKGFTRFNVINATVVGGDSSGDANALLAGAVEGVGDNAAGVEEEEAPF